MKDLIYELGKCLLDFSKLALFALVVSQNLQGWSASVEANAVIFAITIVSGMLGAYGIYFSKRDSDMKTPPPQQVAVQNKKKRRR